MDKIIKIEDAGPSFDVPHYIVWRKDLTGKEYYGILPIYKIEEFKYDY